MYLLCFWLSFICGTSVAGCRNWMIARSSNWLRTISAAVELRNFYRTSIVSYLTYILSAAENLVVSVFLSIFSQAVNELGLKVKFGDITKTPLVEWNSLFRTFVNTPYQVSTWLTYPWGMEGWLSLGGWVHTEMVYLSAESTVQVLSWPAVELLCWLRSVC